jgi:DTW domain-containing protein YfiP
LNGYGFKRNVCKSGIGQWWLFESGRHSSMTSEADEWLDNYLKRTKPKDWPRVFCCNSSRSLYCPECCQILIPTDDWPSAVREGSLRFPFDIDILLGVKERRTSATGIHAAAIFAAMDSSGGHNAETSTNLAERLSDSKPQTTSKTVRLYDLNRVEIPAYDPTEIGTYVLFPDKSSVPITSVAGQIRKLVVLDVKWSRQGVKMDPAIESLPKVHLDAPPAQSRYWRWHNSGEGMLSTIEAIYFAAMEVATGWTQEERERLTQIMWLFALQRSVIHVHSELEQRPSPFTEEGKHLRRVLRQKQSKSRGGK